MIRVYNTKDLPEIMEIWLHTNCEAHAFIEKNYWEGLLALVIITLKDYLSKVFFRDRR